MTHSMPSKALWESGFAFLSSWLGDFWSAPAKLRGFFTLMKSLELVVQHTGMHSLTQPLVHMHRFCMFISLYSDNSQNFAAEELSKKFRKARLSLDVPLSLTSHRRGLKELPRDTAFTADFTEFIVALQTLDDLHKAVTAGPFADLVKACHLIYQDIEVLCAAYSQIYGSPYMPRSQPSARPTTSASAASHEAPVDLSGFEPATYRHINVDDP